VNNNDERDHSEDAANRADAEAEGRADAEAEGRAEYEAERIERVRQRLKFTTEAAGIRLHVDGTAYRILIEAPRRKRDLPALVALLDQAAELGAVHGQCDSMAELAADLLGQPLPFGHVTYDITPARALTMHRDDTVTTLPVPDGLKPFYIIGQLARALSDVFSIAGQLADEPDAPTPPAQPEPAADPR
jgi:hypothetical protein